MPYVFQKLEQKVAWNLVCGIWLSVEEKVKALDAVEESEVSKGEGRKRWMEVVKDKEGSCDGRSKLVLVILSWKFG